MKIEVCFLGVYCINLNLFFGVKFILFSLSKLSQF